MKKVLHRLKNCVNAALAVVKKSNETNTIHIFSYTLAFLLGRKREL